jgi:osmotically-inducible protein OsmY
MKRMLFSFLVGVAAGALGHWYLQQEEGKRAMAEARETVSLGAEKAKDALLLGVDEIKEELSRTGKVIRDKRKSIGHSGTNAAPANTTATAAQVQARLAADRSLAGHSIHVEVNNSVVTLSGDVTSYAQIDRAMKLALETDDVQKVVSLLRVSSSR